MDNQLVANLLHKIENEIQALWIPSISFCLLRLKEFLRNLLDSVVGLL